MAENETTEDTTMKVATLRQTPEPEKLVCQYARGDYWDGFVPDTPYAELMAGVGDGKAPLKDHHIEYALKQYDESYDAIRDPYEREGGVLTYAKQCALIEDLITSGHWGPFEHPQLNLHARGSSRVLMAQITRHRQLTFDIQSQRYVDFSSKEHPFKVPATLREDSTDKQRVNREKGLTELDDDVKAEMREKGDELVQQAIVLYDEMVENGVPKEDARFYLPEGTKVNIGFSGNARALLHVMNMRKQADAQWEARELSGMMLDEFKQWMPWTYEAFDRHGPFRLSP